MLINKLLPINFFRIGLNKPSNLKNIKYSVLFVFLLISVLIYFLKIFEYKKFNTETRII